MLQILQQSGVSVREGCKVLRVDAGSLTLIQEEQVTAPESRASSSTAGASQQQYSSTDGVDGNSDGAGVKKDGAGSQQGAEEQLAFDECLWCTQAAAAGWIKDTGLPTGKARHHTSESKISVALWMVWFTSWCCWRVLK